MGGSVESRRVASRRWSAAHPEKRREWGRAYHYRHREKELKRGRNYKLNHPDKVKGWHERRKVSCADCGSPCRGRAVEPRCHHCAAKYYRGEKRGKVYKGGIRISSEGYRVVRKDGRERYEHRVVWEAANGPIPRGWIVHHLNGDKLDNRIENLIAVSRSDHYKLHSLGSILGTIEKHVRGLESRLRLGRPG